jgi:hypothetical protein
LPEVAPLYQVEQWLITLRMVLKLKQYFQQG